MVYNTVLNQNRTKVQHMCRCYRCEAATLCWPRCWMDRSIGSGWVREMTWCDVAIFFSSLKNHSTTTVPLGNYLCRRALLQDCHCRRIESNRTHCTALDLIDWLNLVDFERWRDNDYGLRLLLYSAVLDLLKYYRHRHRRRLRWIFYSCRSCLRGERTTGWCFVS